MDNPGGLRLFLRIFRLILGRFWREWLWGNPRLKPAAAGKGPHAAFKVLDETVKGG